MSPELRDVFFQRFSTLLGPNLVYAKENVELLASIRTQVSDRKRVFYKRGDLLVPRGKPVTLLDVHRVQDCLDKSRPDRLLVGAGSFLPFCLLTLVFVSVARGLLGSGRSPTESYLPLFFVLISILFCAKALYLFTNLNGVAIPMAAGGLVVALLLDFPFALLVTLLTAVYMTFLTTLDMGLFIYYLIGGVVFVAFAARTRRRVNLLFYSILVGALNVVLLACMILLRDEFPNQSLMIDLAPQAFLSAPGAWLLAMLIMPLSERLFGLASSDRLRELADLNHPLLKRLQEKAPGTYYHSLAVANLAAVAAEAVGANVQLVRAGAYYHDIGKTMDPEYFIENQNNRENPHDNLEPISSYEIVKSHVKDGVAIAEKYRFPQAVVDLIAEHHGTTVIEAFFTKAQKKQPDVYTNRDFFRYEGPKPRGVESGILMIADVLEAVGRLLKTTNPMEVREKVHRVIVNKFEDGQFDLCGLSTSVFADMETALVQTLLRILHKRIDYPEETSEPKTKAVA
jgi:putative nucleotidyltransferase with HDIG domain